MKNNKHPIKNASGKKTTKKNAQIIQNPMLPQENLYKQPYKND